MRCPPKHEGGWHLEPVELEISGDVAWNRLRFGVSAVLKTGRNSVAIVHRTEAGRGSLIDEAWC